MASKVKEKSEGRDKTVKIEIQCHRENVKKLSRK